MAESRNRPLQVLAADVRERTLQILLACRPEELTWSPPGTANHILWHAGHALWLQDVLCLRLLSGCGALPAGWENLFGMGSRPDQLAQPWPSRDEVAALLRAQLPRLVQVIGTLTESDLDALPPHAHPRDSRTLGQCVVHGLHDEACHQGEMYLLLKMQRGRANQRD
jgi:hypothetical protein